METPIKVKVPGGEGTVDFRDGSSWLRGPVEYVFEGVWEPTQG
jgi:diaminopimelate epimerase